jgi:hypothetical protein
VAFPVDYMHMHELPDGFSTIAVIACVVTNVLRVVAWEKMVRLA